MRTVFFFIYILSSCQAKKGPLTYSLSGERLLPVRERPELITLEFIQEKILIPQCIQCHEWVSDPAQIQRRVTAGNPDTSRLFRVMENGRMPPRPVPPVGTDDLELLREYIGQLK